MSEHIIEMAGARVRIADGRIEVLTDPLVTSCPLRRDLYGCVEESRETVERVLKEHMAELGMYSSDRVLELEMRPVSFGASETIADAMDAGLIDAAVAVCDGAGTVIVTNPRVLQATGAHMTGLEKTSPIPEVQEGLLQRGCLLLDRQGTIDQVGGYKRALEAGYERIAVTVTGRKAEEAREIRQMDETRAPWPAILAVHNTAIDEAHSQVLAESCDLVWSCASRWAREVVGRRARMQIGLAIPVFALTDLGKRLVLNRAERFEEPLVIHRGRLPLLRGDRQPEPLV